MEDTVRVKYFNFKDEVNPSNEDLERKKTNPAISEKNAKQPPWNRYNCLFTVFLALSLSFGFIVTLSMFFYLDYTMESSLPLDRLSSSWMKVMEKQKSKVLTPEQLHLSLGANSSEIYVTWSTLEATQCQLVYRRADEDGPFGGGEVVDGHRTIKILTTTSGWFNETLTRNLYTYRAKIRNLESDNLYVYRVQCSDGDDEDFSLYSTTYYYQSKDLSDSQRPIKLALYGDLGLVNGQSVPRLIEDVDRSKYDLIIHNGDFAYDLNTENAQYGDKFMRLIEPIAARVPYQTSVGNHEVAENFTHYDHRFTMVNSGGIDTGIQNNFFYSFNAGPVHFLAISTEFYYFLDYVGIEALDNQYEWIKKDLSHATSKAERAKRPWIVVFGHRPMYCSSRDGDDCSKDSNILRKGLPFLGTYALEKLFYEFGVDVQFYSHEHQYERFLPIYDGRVMSGTDDPTNPYHNPLGPVHIISGSAGCQERIDPFKGKPTTGSVKQIADYGYTRLKASRCELSFEQVSDDQVGTIVDSFTISKSKQNYPSKSDESFDCRTKAVPHHCPKGSNKWICPLY